MIDTLEKVESFHRVFGRLIRDNPCVKNQQVNRLRLKLLKEEYLELSEALHLEDQVATLDALSDLQYILDGTYLSLGFAHVKYEAFMRVHISNMAKMGPNGKPIIRADGKIIKPEGWIPPDLRDLCDKQQKPF